MLNSALMHLFIFTSFPQKMFSISAFGKDVTMLQHSVRRKKNARHKTLVISFVKAWTIF